MVERERDCDFYHGTTGYPGNCLHAGRGGFHTRDPMTDWMLIAVYEVSWPFPVKQYADMTDRQMRFTMMDDEIEMEIVVCANPVPDSTWSAIDRKCAAMIQRKEQLL